jgi:hypothetical protein
VGHSRQQYEDRIRARLGDLGVVQHIADPTIPLALETALATFAKDHPRARRQTYSGDGTTRLFDLLAGTSTYQPGWSRITAVEHPTGTIPPELVEPSDYYTEEDDGTATLILHEAPATGTNNIRVTYLAPWPFPTDDPDDDPISDIYWPAICSLAAAELARGKAVEFARQASTSVAGDLFQRDATSLFEAATQLRKAYEATVLGRPTEEGGTATQVHMAVTDVDVFPNSLYHRREDYIAEEAAGG